MATIPLSGTTISLLSGIPFSNDYKHTRYFDTLSDQTSWFSSQTVVHSMSQAKFQRIEGVPSHSMMVDSEFDNLLGVNYVMFQNALYGSKWFYGFVTKIEYVNIRTTRVHFELDVFQTWWFNRNFLPSFVVREHCSLWNTDGTPVINTVSEQLNYGTEYDVKKVTKWNPYGASDNPLFFMVIASKTVLENTTHPFNGEINGYPQPLNYYIIPFYRDGTPATVTIGGTSKTVDSPLDVLIGIYTSVNSVDDIVSIYITENPGLNIMDNSGTFDFVNTEVSPVTITGGKNGDVHTLALFTIYNFHQVTKDFGSKYANFTTVTESKLLMYPYTQTLLTDLKGNQTILKNEYINDTNLKVTSFGSLGTENKNAYVCENYLVTGTDTDTKNTTLGHGIINNDPNDVPVLVSYLSAFIQGNKNQIKNKMNELMTKGITDLAGNGIGMVASVLSANPMGFASSVEGAVKGTENSYYKAKALNAKVSDIQNHPPSVAKMGSNSAFDFGNQINGLYVIQKEIKPEYRQKLQNFFNMYGYQLNDIKIPNFHTRQNWNYVQTNGCNITGNFNNNDLQELKSIFDRGITLWHTDDIGNYSLSNGVI